MLLIEKISLSTVNTEQMEKKMRKYKINLKFYWYAANKHTYYMLIS